MVSVVPVGRVLSVSVRIGFCCGFASSMSIIGLVCVMLGSLCVMSTVVFCVISGGIMVVLLVAMVILALYFLYSRYALITGGGVSLVCFR